MAESPSLSGRAPVPPLEVTTIEKPYLPLPPGTGPRTLRFQRQDVPSAGTRSGIAWRRHPKTTSGSICPITWRDRTGAGGCAFNMQSLGALTVRGPSEPALFGMRAATMQPRPKTV